MLCWALIEGLLFLLLNVGVSIGHPVSVLSNGPVAVCLSVPVLSVLELVTYRITIRIAYRIPHW